MNPLTLPIRRNTYTAKRLSELGRHVTDVSYVLFAAPLITLWYIYSDIKTVNIVISLMFVWFYLSLLLHDHWRTGITSFIVFAPVYVPLAASIWIFYFAIDKDKYPPIPITEDETVKDRYVKVSRIKKQARRN